MKDCIHIEVNRKNYHRLQQLVKKLYGGTSNFVTVEVNKAILNQCGLLESKLKRKKN